MYGVDLYRRVRLACHREGLSGREAARRFGIDRKTVKCSPFIGQVWRRFKLRSWPADQFSITLLRRQDCRLEVRA